MRLTVNGHVAQYLGMEKSRHVFRTQVAWTQRLVCDLLLTQSEVGKRAGFRLQVDKQSFQEDLRPAGNGRRAAWVITSSALSVGKHELRILELTHRSPWGVIELELTEPKQERRMRPIPSGNSLPPYAPYVVAAMAIAVALVWLIRAVAL